MDDPKPFDPTAAVAQYRDVMGKRDAATDEPGRAEFDGIARRLRDRWKDWQGEDSLNEMAFGEPQL